MATYTSAATGLWSAGATWVGGVKPPSGAGHQVVLAHEVTYDEALGVYGSDPGNQAAGAITINAAGKLKFSRAVSTSLTARGQILQNGPIDIGTEADPIPAGVTAALVYNDSATMANAKYGMTTSATAGGFSAWGAPKTPETGVVSVTSTTVFDVSDASGWTVGDKLFLGPTANTGAATIEVRAITALTPVSGTQYTVTIGAAPTNTTAVGRRVVNVTRNVSIRPQTAQTFGATFTLGLNNVSLADNFLELGPCEIVGLGSASATATGAGCVLTLAKTSQVKKVSGPVFHDVVSVSGSTITTCAAPVAVGGLSSLIINTGSAFQATLSDVVCATKQNARGPSIGGSATFTLARPVVIGATMAFPNAVGAASAYRPRITGGKFYGFTDFTGGLFLGIDVVDSTFDAFSRLGFTIAGVTSADMLFSGCNIGATIGATNASDFFRGGSTQQVWRFDSCVMPSGFALSRATAALASLPPASYLLVKNKNNDPSLQEKYTYGGQQLRENTVVKRGASSVRFDCWHAANPLTYSFAVKVAANQTIDLLGAMRYTSTYGTGTPPTVTISGLGITPVVATCPTSGADTWHDYSISATNPNAYPGEVTVTYTGQSAANSTGAYCYFDGVIDSPWVDSARHGGYLYDTNAYKTADPSRTVSDATALAYPVTVNHGTSLITVTGNATARQVYEFLMADLAVTANQGVPVHVSTGDGGATFTTSYDITVDTGVTLTGSFTTSGDVTLTGTAAVVGVYTDSAGAHIAISAPSMVEDTWVYLYNVTDSTLIYKGQVGPTGLFYPTTWTADKVVEYRFGYSDATVRKMPVSGTGVLSATGLTVLDTQVDDTVYAGISGDPATWTQFVPDFPNLQIDIPGGGTIRVPELYKWASWAEASSDGIELMFGAITSDDGVNVKVNVDKVDAKLQNPNVGTITQVIDGYIFRSDGSSWIVPGPGFIEPIVGRAYLAGGASIAADVWAATTRTLTDGAAANVAAVKAKTDNLPAAPAAVSDIPTTAQVADKVLGRSLAGGADGGRTVQDALRASRNKTGLVGSTLTVYQEDDTTPAWTASVTTAERDALSGIDPA